ncbi:MAG: Flp/Fap pilin component [Planctomycetota bacterium]
MTVRKARAVLLRVRLKSPSVFFVRRRSAHLVIQGVLCSESAAMSKFISAVRRLLVREEGATMVEYGLMVALIAIVAVAAVGTLGGRVSDTFEGLTF